MRTVEPPVGVPAVRDPTRELGRPLAPAQHLASAHEADREHERDGPGCEPEQAQERARHGALQLAGAAAGAALRPCRLSSLSAAVRLWVSDTMGAGRAGP